MYNKVQIKGEKMLENTIDLRHFGRSLWDLRKYRR
jgi:hypothetical protein